MEMRHSCLEYPLTLSTQLEIPIHLGLPLNSLNPRLFFSDHKYTGISGFFLFLKIFESILKDSFRCAYMYLLELFIILSDT